MLMKSNESIVHKIDQNSDKMDNLRKEVASDVTQIRSQVNEMVDEMAEMRNNMTTIRDDTKRTVQEANQEMMDYVNNQLDERLARLEEIEKKQVNNTTDVVRIDDVPIVSPQHSKRIDLGQQEDRSWTFSQ